MWGGAEHSCGCVRTQTYVRASVWSGCRGGTENGACGASVGCTAARTVPVVCWRRLGRVAPALPLCGWLRSCRSGAPSRRPGSVAPCTTTQEWPVESGGYPLRQQGGTSRGREPRGCGQSTPQRVSFYPADDPDAKREPGRRRHGGRPVRASLGPRGGGHLGQQRDHRRPATKLLHALLSLGRSTARVHVAMRSLPRPRARNAVSCATSCTRAAEDTQ